MKPFLLVISLLTCAPVFSQYYYNDILSNRQSNEQYQLLKVNKIKKIKVNSYDADNQPAQGFSLEQEFSPDYKELTTNSATASGMSSLLVTYFENNRVSETHEIAGNVDTRVKYGYDDQGRLLNITSVTVDTSAQLTSTERHLWSYDNDNRPLLMLKIKNGGDTIRVEMITDEQGNPAEEHWKGKGTDIETYYYYYNGQHRLTDIVRFNQKAQKLLPDFLFEHDAEGRVNQVIQVPTGSSNYMVWQTTFNDKGLKQQETGHDRQKQLVGRMEYVYQ